MPMTLEEQLIQKEYEAALAAFELGFTFGEKGFNLQAALIKFDEIWKKP